MAKTSISGFPEWLPAEQAVLNAVLEKVRQTFKLFGFLDVDARAVEPVSALLAKGETSKEVYLLSRLQEAYEGSGTVDLKSKLDSPKQLGLHFDLTIPFARYVQENAGLLQFPFRRTSIGKVWRGERPQEGRFREFIQADVDIVAQLQPGQEPLQALPIFNDVEVVKAVDWALTEVLSPDEKTGLNDQVLHCIHINNRKLLQGAYQVFGVKDVPQTMRVLDKIAKIGEDEVANQLLQNGENAQTSAKCIELAQIQTASISELKTHSLLPEITKANKLAEEGLVELIYLLEGVGQNAVADLSITRGLDYYTGSVFETFIDGHADFGSIASGGRYENLAASLSKTDGKKALEYPGVGMSIGITRLTSFLLSNASNNSTAENNDKFQQAEVLVAVNDEEHRLASVKVADELRAAGKSAYVSPTSAKFGKQIDFASKRGIPYVLFIDEAGQKQIKDIRTGEQHVWYNV